MSSTARLITKARERLALSCYTPWETEFIAGVVARYDKGVGLTEKQVDKLRQIVLERWVQGKNAPRLYR